MSHAVLNFAWGPRPGTARHSPTDLLANISARVAAAGLFPPDSSLHREPFSFSACAAAALRRRLLSARYQITPRRAAATPSACFCRDNLRDAVHKLIRCGAAAHWLPGGVQAAAAASGELGHAKLLDCEENTDAKEKAGCAAQTGNSPLESPSRFYCPTNYRAAQGGHQRVRQGGRQRGQYAPRRYPAPSRHAPLASDKVTQTPITLSRADFQA